MLHTETAIDVRPEAACCVPLTYAADLEGRLALEDLHDFSLGGGAAPQGAAPGAAGALLFDRRMEPEEWPFPPNGCLPEHLV